MNTSFQKQNNGKSTDEWYTPPYIIESLGKFDLDPCAPVIPLFRTAAVMYNKNDDGLSKPWEGRVFLNPPYSRPLIELFIQKMADHNNGIALLFNRCDNKIFHDIILKKASGIKFLRKRICFLRPDGNNSGRPGSGSILVSFNEENRISLQNNKLEGKFINL